MPIACADCESVSALRVARHNLLPDGLAKRDNFAMELGILAMLPH